MSCRIYAGSESVEPIVWPALDGTTSIRPRKAESAGAADLSETERLSRLLAAAEAKAREARAAGLAAGKEAAAAEITPVLERLSNALSDLATFRARLRKQSEADLVKLGETEMIRIGLLNEGDVIDGVVFRQPKAYPVYTGEYKAYLAQIKRFIEQIPNLQTTGRNGLHMYNNQDHSMLTAMMTLWNMRGAAHDVWSVNTDFDYHEEQSLARKPDMQAASA